jgi:hypothetical protein
MQLDPARKITHYLGKPLISKGDLENYLQKISDSGFKIEAEMLSEHINELQRIADYLVERIDDIRNNHNKEIDTLRSTF